jgi:hypothetical protein
MDLFQRKNWCLILKLNNALGWDRSVLSLEQTASFVDANLHVSLEVVDLQLFDLCVRTEELGCFIRNRQEECCLNQVVSQTCFVNVSWVDQCFGLRLHRSCCPDEFVYDFELKVVLAQLNEQIVGNRDKSAHQIAVGE